MSVKLRKRKLKSGETSLFLDIYQSGGREYEFLGLYLTKDRASNKETLKLAENIRAKRQLELQNTEHGFVPHFKKKANFVEYFERITLGKAKEDKAWHNTFKHLKDFTSGHIRFSGISEQWLEEVKSYFLAKVSPNTAHTYFSKIKAALRQAVKEKIIVDNPGERVGQIKKQDTERTFLELDELQRLAVTPCSNPEVKRAFLFSCYSGLRLSDVEKLEWQNIQGERIDFRQKKTSGFEYMPLSATAKKILSDNQEPNVLHMPNSKVFSMPSQTQTAKSLKQWCEEAEISKPVTFHTARHTFATLALTQGVDLYTVGKLLGHKNIQATQIYAKIVDTKKREAGGMLPEIEVIYG